MESFNEKKGLPLKSSETRSMGLLFDNLVLLSIEDVAAFLGKKPQTIRNWVAQERIPHIPGRPVMFLRDSLLKWLEGKEKKPWQ